jgi:hypothetical protein
MGHAFLARLKLHRFASAQCNTRIWAGQSSLMCDLCRLNGRLDRHPPQGQPCRQLWTSRETTPCASLVGSVSSVILISPLGDSVVCWLLSGGGDTLIAVGKGASCVSTARIGDEVPWVWFDREGAVHGGSAMPDVDLPRRNREAK